MRIYGTLPFRTRNLSRMARLVVCAAYLAMAGVVQAQTAQPTPLPDGPWKEARAVLDAMLADLQKHGVQGVQPHVADLERVLGRADQAYAAARAGTKDTMYVLTNGLTETLGALAAAAMHKIPGAEGRTVQAIENPYPAVGFFLGSYYNEVHRPADALRVLDVALGLPRAAPGIATGQFRPNLIGERATALVALKRWSEALAAYDEGLAIQPLPPKDKARLMRGRGIPLSELGRLDEAEKAYRDSLVIEPNNPIALNELTYIAHLRSGAPATATRQVLPNAAPGSTSFPGQTPTDHPANPSGEVNSTANQQQIPVGGQNATPASPSVYDAVFVYSRANYFRALTKQQKCETIDPPLFETINARFDRARAQLMARFGERAFPLDLKPGTQLREGVCDRGTLMSYGNHVAEIEQIAKVPN